MVCSKRGQNASPTKGCSGPLITTTSVAIYTWGGEIACQVLNFSDLYGGPDRLKIVNRIRVLGVLRMNWLESSFCWRRGKPRSSCARWRKGLDESFYMTVARVFLPGGSQFYWWYRLDPPQVNIAIDKPIEIGELPLPNYSLILGNLGIKWKVFHASHRRLATSAQHSALIGNLLTPI